MADCFFMQVSLGWTALSGCVQKLRHLRMGVPVGLWFRPVGSFTFKRAVFISIVFLN